MSEVALLEDSIALAAIARGAGITMDQARAVLLRLAALPEEQSDRVVATARALRARALSAQARRADEAEAARRRARREDVR